MSARRARIVVGALCLGACAPRVNLEAPASAPRLGEFDAIRSKADVGAPCFFVDGHVIEGAQPYEVFADEIEAALRRR